MTHLEKLQPSLMEITSRPEVLFTEGQGSWLYDSAGNKYLDFVQGWAVNCLGHCPPTVVSAINTQAGKLINCSPAYFNAPMLELAALLAKTSSLEKVFFTNSGAEANEGAIKLARKWGELHKNGAYEIITLENGFHGRTLATMSASGKAQWEKLFEPKVPGFTKVPINDLVAVNAAITDKTVAVMLEPIQGEAGVIPADDAYLNDLRLLTDELGILLILDEIQTGIGRTGALFAFMHLDIRPDIMTLGKGLGGGVPLAALLASEQIACFEHGDQGGTFNGNPLMTAAGLAVMQQVSEPDFLQQVNENGNYLWAKLQELSDVHGHGAVRGKGLLLALELNAAVAATVSDRALEKGLLLNAPRPTSLRFMPALNINSQEIDAMVEILDVIFREFTET